MALPDKVVLDLGTWTSVLTTALNSLANGDGALSGEIAPSGETDYPYARFELDCDFASAPSAEQPVEVWYVQKDSAATGWEDGAGGASEIVSQWLAWVFTSRAATDLKRMTPLLAKPPEGYKVLLVNKTGVAMAASGNTLQVQHVRDKLID